MRVYLCLGFLGLAFGFVGCNEKRSPEPTSTPVASPAPASPSASAPPRIEPGAQQRASVEVRPIEKPPVSTVEGVATWYEVPEGSLPERRAPGEFTAAYDRLPLGSYVRVTSKATGRAVVVCITDDGVGSRRGIDLCKEAAEEIGLIRKGEMKVVIEELHGRKEVPESK